jgi:hypothetical protein
MELTTTALLSYRNLARPFKGWQGFFVWGWMTLIATGAMAQTSGALSIPFFDDFSTTPVGGQPDSRLWVPGSGVYINNTMPINQPSVNVATFDGLRANGQPYELSNVMTQGYTDTLTSQPINLGGLTAKDSVYLSFYWQIQGLGELPESGAGVLVPDDSLKLEFLTSSNNWEQVWFQVGGVPNLNFPQAFVAIREARFLHAGFQFRFRSFGRQSGPYDAWNIDYLFLNRGRSNTDRYIKDIATRQAVGPSFLKRYTAMPLSQYLVNPAAETADSISTDITNQFNNFNFTSFRFTSTDQATGRVVQDFQQASPDLLPSLSSQRKSVRLTPLTGAEGAKRVVLKHKFDFLTTDDQNPSIPTVNLRRNDTISTTTVLDNYYAYDDGTAEYAVQISRLERVAVRFVLNKEDVMTGVLASLVPFGIDQSGQRLIITVYENSNGRPGRELITRGFPIQNAPSRNGFVAFNFDRGIAVKDTIYVGWQQISNESNALVRIGLDKNSPFGSNLFYRAGSSAQWAANFASPSFSLQGAVMLRPVVGGELTPVVTGNPVEEKGTPLQVYPNPTTGQISWNDAKLNRIEILDLNGRLVQDILPPRGQQSADVRNLPGGMYLFRLSDGQRTNVQRVVVVK